MLMKTDTKPCTPPTLKRLAKYNYRGFLVEVDQVNGRNFVFHAERRGPQRPSDPTHNFANIKECRAYIAGRIDEILMAPSSVYSE